MDESLQDAVVEGHTAQLVELDRAPVLGPEEALLPLEHAAQVGVHEDLHHGGQHRDVVLPESA